MKVLLKTRLNYNLLSVLLLLLVKSALAQDTLMPVIPDTAWLVQDTLRQNDSLAVLDKDTTVLSSSQSLKSIVEYEAEDSITLDMRSSKVYMYNAAAIKYEKVKLDADYIAIDFGKSLAYARGKSDSLGKLNGTPVFSEGGQNYEAEEMTYNYDTQKGFIQKVITEEGDGYIHGEKIKKLEDNSANLAHGRYTTCDLKHPHYSIRFTKARVIPDNKIVTGPAYIELEGVPLPIFIPFGLFPNKKGQTSGILIPTYGEKTTRGFFLENGGYYWGINDYLELYLRGDIYSRGSWAVKPQLNYRKRYKYNGNFMFSYAVNIDGIEGDPDYARSRSYSIRWTHAQDPKARPNGRFNASVNYMSNNYNRYNMVSTQNYLSNTFNSSVAYQATLFKHLRFNASANLTQNTNTHQVTMNMPQLSMSYDRFYPLRRKKPVGKLKWYENISVQYKMNAKNEVKTADSLLFADGFLDDFRSGVKHTIPVSSQIKLLKYFNMNNTITYNEQWAFQTREKNYIIGLNDEGVEEGRVRNDTIPGFKAARDFRFQSSLSTKFYGMKQFKKGPVRAVRHVVTPSVTYTYTPDFGSAAWGYYKYYLDSKGEKQSYSVFEGSLYGSPPQYEAGLVSMSLGNNLEIKVPSRKDTISGMKKIILLESFGISTSYDLAADSLNWKPVRLSGRTTLAKGLTIHASAMYDWYAQDTTQEGRLVTVNQFEYNKTGKLLRYDNSNYKVSLDFRLNSKTLAQWRGEEIKDKELDEKRDAAMKTDPELGVAEGYIDWAMPWSFNCNYQISLNHRYDFMQDKNKENLMHTIRVNGDVNITPKWKVNFRSDFDIVKNDLTYAEIKFHRDLHCWEMSFGWIPLGYQKGWNFAINLKSSLLKDLKLEKKRNRYDRLN